jgi:hypothetical protein
MPKRDADNADLITIPADIFQEGISRLANAELHVAGSSRE